jgi:hypothetical protein
MIPHHIIERHFPTMTKWWMANIMRKAQTFN